MEHGSNFWYYAFPTVLSFIALAGYKKKSTGVVILLILLFFSMFRGDHVGNDTLNYMSDNRIKQKGNTYEISTSAEEFGENFGNRTEFLDIFFYRTVYELNLSPRIIIFTYSLITFLILFFALKRFKVNICIGLLIYVLMGLYYFSLSAARQMAAVSIVLYGMSFLVTNNDNAKYKNIVKGSLIRRYKSLVGYIGCVIIAGMIHASALFFILLYPIKYIRINRKLITWSLIGVTTFCVLLSFNIMNLVYKIINLEYVIRYMGLYEDGGRSITGRIFDVMRFAFLIYIFIYRTNKKEANTYDIIYAMAIVLLGIFVQTNELMARITYFITVFLCVYIPYSMVKEGTIRYGNKFLLFVMYIVISIYGIGKYGSSSLTSGYYLMF